MSRMKKRADGVFNKVGEQVYVDGTRPMKGIFMLLDKNRMHVFFDDIEQDMFDRPALIALVPADAGIAVDDTIQRDERTYTVRRIAKPRYGDEIVSQLVLLT